MADEQEHAPLDIDDDADRMLVFQCLALLGLERTVLLVRKLRELRELHRQAHNKCFSCLFLMAMGLFALCDINCFQLIRMYDHFMNGERPFTQDEIVLLSSYHFVPQDDDDDESQFEVGNEQEEHLAEAVARCRRCSWSEHVPDNVLEVICLLGIRFKTGGYPVSIYTGAVAMYLRGDIRAEDLVDLYDGMYNVQPRLTDDERQYFLTILSY